MRIPTDSLYAQQLQTLTTQYESFAYLQSQIAISKNLVSSSDDPVLASRIELTQNYIDNLNAYSQSCSLAQNRSQLFATSIQQSVDQVINIQNMIVSALDDTKNDTDRQTFATSLQNILSSLLNLANTQDGSGDYIYAGYNVQTPPYALINGTYQYQGGYDSTSINIGPNSTCVYSESGYNVFGNIPLGNGTFTVNAAPTNTGTAYTDQGDITNMAAYVPDTYTISFVTNSSGKTGYVVTGAVSGQVIPPPSQPTPADAPSYPGPGSNVTFNGISINFSGEPQAGDSFTVAPSVKQDIFDTLQGLINALKTPIDGNPVARAQFHQTTIQAQAAFGQITDSLLNYQSNVGTRLNMVLSQKAENDTLVYDQTTVLSQLSDLNIVQAFSQLDQQKLALQVTQGTYNVITDLLQQLMQSR